MVKDCWDHFSKGLSLQLDFLIQVTNTPLRCIHLCTWFPTADDIVILHPVVPMSVIPTY
uniref:Uncharacterized protein n=1 Tax=Rhizophora mucronata TaxID=61149 RepID=A0A2P2QVA9_RHIMU